MSQGHVIAPWKSKSEDNEDVTWALSTAEALLGRGERVEAIRWVRKAAEQAAEAGEDDRALELARSAADLASEPVEEAAPGVRPTQEASAPAEPSLPAEAVSATPEELFESDPPPLAASPAPAELPPLHLVASPVAPSPVASPVAVPPVELEPPAALHPAESPAVERVEAEALAERPSAAPGTRADMMADMMAAALRPLTPLEPAPVVAVTSALPPVPSQSGAPMANRSDPAIIVGSSPRSHVTQSVRVFLTPLPEGGVTITLANGAPSPLGSIDALLVALAPDADLVGAFLPK